MNEKLKEIVEMFKELDYYEQGKLAYKIEIECPYAVGSPAQIEWKRGEIAASLADGGYD